MEQNDELLKRYNFLVDTLIMCAPDFKILTEDEIADCLTELEGDFHSFLYPDNLVIFKTNGIINDNQIGKILQLREMISNVSPKLWNIDAFKQEKSWLEIHLLANEILTSLGITQRKIEQTTFFPSGWKH